MAQTSDGALTSSDGAWLRLSRWLASRTADVNATLTRSVSVKSALGWAVAAVVTYKAVRFAVRRVRASDLGRFGGPAHTWHASVEAFGNAIALATQLDALATQLESLTVLPVVGGISAEYKSRQRHIREILAHTCSADELNYVLVACNLALVLSHAGPPSVKLLATPAADGGRLDDLSPVARAALVDAMQKVGVTWWEQPWIQSVFCHTTGADLTALKNLVDNGGDYHSVHKLVYEDVWLPPVRSAILDHIAREGRRLLDTDGDGTVSDAEVRRARHKVLVDVDDTLVCSGGSLFAGIDTRFSKGTVYPGVCALLRELDLGPDNGAFVEDTHVFAQLPGGKVARVRAAGSDTISVVAARVRESQGADGDAPQKLLLRGAANEQLCSIAFLSARPHTFRDITESHSYALFASLVDTGRLHTMPTLLPGKLVSGIKAVLPTFSAWALLKALMRRRDADAVDTSNWLPVGLQKHASAAQFLALYPEYRSVFVGDSGQGDVVAAERMLEAPGTTVKAALLHEVLPRKHCLSLHSDMSLPEREALWAERNICFFRTYAGAAAHAYRLGLIHIEGLQRVVSAAASELLDLIVRDPLRISAPKRSAASSSDGATAGGEGDGEFGGGSGGDHSGGDSAAAPPMPLSPPSFGSAPSPWDDLIAELNADIETANTVLPEGRRVMPVQAPMLMVRQNSFDV